MPDESLPARRKIGLERRYDGRQYAADALTRRRNRVFRHRQKKAENWNPGKVSRGEFTTEDTENAEIIHRLHRCSQAPVARLYYRGANVADGAQRRGYRVRRRHTCRYNKRQRSEEHTSELQSLRHLVCRLLLEKKKGYYMVVRTS